MDPATLESLYRTHGPHVLRRARRVLGSDQEAREVLHDIFTSLLGDPSQFRGASSPTTWLYAATTHACLNRIRNQKSRARLLAENPPLHESAGTSESGAPRALSLSIVRDLLARVPEALAQAALYAYVDEMTHEEIATVLSCSRRHVGDLLQRLHEHLHTLESAP